MIREVMPDKINYSCTFVHFGKSECITLAFVRPLKN
jgi:hypothetical protein